MFECADEQGCTFVCSAHEIGQLAQYSPCETSYHVDSLINEEEYAFIVVATDGVGNVGQPVVHQWMIGECKCLFVYLFTYVLYVRQIVVSSSHNMFIAVDAQCCGGCCF